MRCATLRSASRFLPWLLAIALTLTLVPRVSQAKRPSNKRLVLAGSLMAVPTYMLGVSIHEGSHALAAKMLGLRIVDYSLIPGFHPRTGNFFFGYVSVLGLRSQKDRALFLAAPKFTDAIFLGGFAALHALDGYPSNAYAKTAVLVLATGFWVDFSKDIFSFGKHNDTVKLYSIFGLKNEWQRIPARLAHVGLSVAFGYSIMRGYQELFKRSGASDATTSAVLMPLWDSRF